MRALDFIGFPNYAVTKDGQVISLRKGKELKQILNHNYLKVSLGRERAMNVHRLVALAFVENPLPEINTQVNHIDGNKLNNHFSNLEWVTPQENTLHAIRTGLKKEFRSLHRRSISDEVVHEICRMLEAGEKNRVVSKATGVPSPLVAKIKYGINYKEISENYEFRKQDNSEPST